MGRRTSESKRKKIEAEILAALERLIAGCGALDMGAAFGPFSRSSEFRMIGADGSLCDFETFYGDNVSYLGNCSAFSLATIASDVLVLRSDLAVLSWIYRAEATLANGERDVIERAGATFVFEKREGRWVAVRYQESSLPPVRERSAE